MSQKGRGRDERQTEREGKRQVEEGGVYKESKNREGREEGKKERKGVNETKRGMYEKGRGSKKRDCQLREEEEDYKEKRGVRTWNKIGERKKR